ncbi:MAG: ABC transporter ATP-binding protein [Proteobacteria bacterium]|nr:ABC transporter ATP-binding protein [Pseudomonadota bacterium]
MIRFESAQRLFPKTGTGIGPLDLEIGDGEWVTLLGPSGCGKTTLLRLVAGLETLGNGALQNSFSRRQLSYVFQEAALLPWLTVLENIILPLTLNGLSKTAAIEKARPWLEKLRIERHSGSHPDELSGGIKMRVSLARALITDPGLLLLDEPFAALDEPIRIELGLELRELFRNLRPTILMVTHSITEGLWLSDRVLVFHGQPGKLVLDQKMGLPGKRSLAERGDPRFLALVERCFSILKEGLAS